MIYPRLRPNEVKLDIIKRPLPKPKERGMIYPRLRPGEVRVTTKQTIHK